MANYPTWLQNWHAAATTSIGLFWLSWAAYGWLGIGLILPLLT